MRKLKIEYWVATLALVVGCGGEMPGDLGDEDLGAVDDDKADDALVRPIGTFDAAPGAHAGQFTKLVLMTDKTFHRETTVNCVTTPCNPIATNGRYEYRRNGVGTRFIRFRTTAGRLIDSYAYTFSDSIGVLKLRKTNMRAWFTMQRENQPAACCAGPGNSCPPTEPVCVPRPVSFDVEIVSIPGAVGRTVWNVRAGTLMAGKVSLIAGTLEGPTSPLKAVIHHFVSQDGNYQHKQRIELPATVSTNYPPYHTFEGLSVADVQGQGKPDVFATVPDKIFRLRNDGRGMLRDPEALPGRITQVIAGRLTDSGRDQLVVYESAERAIKLLSFDSQGDLSSTKTLIVLGAEVQFPPVFDGIAIADLNNDGRNDILVCGANVALVQDGRGGFIERPLGIPVAINGTISAGDVDGDGIPEIAVTDATPFIDFPGKVRVYKGTVDTGYQQVFEASAGDNHPQSVLLQDLDGDRRAELILPGFDTGDVFVYQARADGSLDPQVRTTHARRTATEYGGVYYVRALPNASGGADILTTSENGIAILRTRL